MQQTIVDNRYSVLHLLGSGGMGHVYLARDELLGREVALKMLKEPYTDEEEFVERFRREARNAATLSHPNIVPVYDMGKAEDGTPYIAMEYMAGGTLGELMAREGTLEAPEAAAIAIQIARALAEAHRCGVIHRDVKSHNVFLAESPASSGTTPEGLPLGAVKVGDFGIARAAEASTMTESGLILGTPHYLSPEQAKGEPVGPKSDLYSLGIVLYEMLTGRVPFDAEDSIAITMKHISEPPPSPKEVNPGMPEDMNTLVLRLLSKDPKDRHGDAVELIEDLTQVRAGLPTALLPAKPAEVPVSPEETKLAVPATPRDLDEKLRGSRKERADIPSAAVLYGSDQKPQRISPWILAVASVAMLAILLGVVGRNLIQNYTEQASITSLQDTAQDPAGTPREPSEETESIASGTNTADGEETKARPPGSSSQNKTPNYTVPPSYSVKQGSGSDRVVAVPAALITQSSVTPESAAPTAPQAPQVRPTPEEVDPTTSTSEADLATSSSGEPNQRIVVVTKTQKTTGPEEPDTKRAKSQRTNRIRSK